jgi:Phytanoyl-CoA dioxygenase (PhyH)
VSVPVSQGYAIVHHQNVWHGSGPNRSNVRHRRALVGHYLRGDVQFRAGVCERERECQNYILCALSFSIPFSCHHLRLLSVDDAVQTTTPWGRTSYIYGRYKCFQSVEVNESFFPIVYASSGQERTSWLDDYIQG